MKELIVKIKSLIKKYIPFSNYRKVKIETLLKAKSNLEQSIKKDIDSIEKLFSKKGKQNLLAKVYANIQKKNLQLVYFKLAQQKANLITHSDGRSNFVRIYELSNLNNEKEYLENVKKHIAKLKLPKEEFDEPNKLIQDLVLRIQTITEELSEFNKTESIRVQLVPGLNLL